MTTIPQQIQAVNNNVSSLRAMVNGLRDPGKLYAILGDACVYGCKINQGTTAADMCLALNGEAVGDGSHLNPDIETNPLRHEEYPNIAIIYGEIFEMGNVNTLDEGDSSLILSDAPGTVNYGRYDIVYAYIGKSGPAVGILTGAAAAAVKTAFIAGGLDSNSYPSTFDGVLPKGTLALARVYVQTGDTGIANDRIADLRNFKGKLNVTPKTGRFHANTGSGLGIVNTACRVFATIVDNACPGLTHTTDSNNGSKFTATEKGQFQFVYTDIGQGATSYMGLSKNSTSLNVSVESLTPAELHSRFVRTATGLTKIDGFMSTLIDLDVGDFVVCHNTIGTYTGESSRTSITITKILNN